jgi:hypothetical protein
MVASTTSRGLSPLPCVRLLPLGVDPARVAPEQVDGADADVAPPDDADVLGDEHDGVADADVDRQVEPLAVLPVQAAQVDDELPDARARSRRAGRPRSGPVGALPDAAVEVHVGGGDDAGGQGDEQRGRISQRAPPR